jgi:hypothetical protein
MYSSNKLGNFSKINVSGLSFKFDPLFHLEEKDLLQLSSMLTSPGRPSSMIGIESIPMVQDIRIQGQPLDPNATYKMATGGGLIYALEFINKNIINLISLDSIQDTQVEDWRILADHIQALSPITQEKLQDQDRIQTLQQDLGISSENLTWEPIRRTQGGMLANIRVKVRNYGAAASTVESSTPPTVQLMSNRNGVNYAVDPEYYSLSDSQGIPSLSPGESKEYQWQAIVPEYDGIYPITAQIHGVNSEVNHSNDQVTRLFKLDELN